MEQHIINLYDEYIHSPIISRADFLKKLTLITGSLAASQTLLGQIENKYQNATTTSIENLVEERIIYPGVPSEMSAYVVKPTAQKSYAAVIVIHENRGLNAHIEDVARRVAQAGYLAIAPNALSALEGDLPTNEDDARAKFSELKPENSLTNFINVFDYLETRKDFNGTVGCVGFCWGGAMANSLAVSVPSLKAAVAFYGRQPASDQVSKINAAIQLHYAAQDERINIGMQAYEDALKASGKAYEQYYYEGVQHAFHNDTSAARYNEAAAKLAWSRVIAFFEKHLS
jgi:carboxymethylenebutenolidase